ncbi:MAG TPA: hypothetical protein VFO62_00925 [Candidatus Binatia bacterium]|nr:hypothetical protein [Candidatus Binatia bacterium]
MAKKKAFDIDPREMFILLESLVTSMDVFRGGKRGGGYDAMSPEVRRQLNETHDLFLKLEEAWDALPERDRAEGTAEPFEVRGMLAVVNPGRPRGPGPRGLARSVGERVQVQQGRGPGAKRWLGTVVEVDERNNAVVKDSRGRRIPVRGYEMYDEDYEFEAW